MLSMRGKATRGPILALGSSTDYSAVGLSVYDPGGRQHATSCGRGGGGMQREGCNELRSHTIGTPTIYSHQVYQTAASRSRAIFSAACFVAHFPAVVRASVAGTATIYTARSAVPSRAARTMPKTFAPSHRGKISKLSRRRRARLPRRCARRTKRGTTDPSCRTSRRGSHARMP